VDVAVYVAVISGICAVTAAVYTARSAHRTTQEKTEAEERVALRQIEAGAYERAKQFYEGTLTRMQDEIDRQAGQIDGQARQIGALQRQLARLLRQVRDAGLVPVINGDEET
jgi:predicted RNase H-like nuclease (RuvC/YqgF family)